MPETETIVHKYGGSLLTNEEGLNFHATGILTCTLGFAVYMDTPIRLMQQANIEFEADRVNFLGEVPKRVTAKRSVEAAFQGYHLRNHAFLALDGLLWTAHAGELNLSERSLSLKLSASIPPGYVLSGSRYEIKLVKA